MRISQALRAAVVVGGVCLHGAVFAQQDDQRLFENFGDFDEFDALIEEALDAFEEAFEGPTVEFDSDLASQGYSLELTAGGDTTSAECVGYFPELSQLIVDYEPVPGVDEIRIFAESDSDTTLWVTINGADDRCDDDSYGNANPLVVVPTSDLGDGDELVVRVGTYNEGFAAARLSVEATWSAVSSGGTKSRPEAQADSGATEFIDLSEGFTPDPVVIPGIAAGGPTSPGLDGCAFGNVPEIPQASLIYNNDSGRSNLVIYAESSADTTLHVVYEDDDYFCDDDSHGDANPIVVIEDAPSGQYLIWVGTYSEDQSAVATLHFSEKMR